jgi:hypothetical protein
MHAYRLVLLGVWLILSTSLFADSPATLNNDDSCDIIVAPAATLLLPRFDVDPAGGETTLFTVTNVTQIPQIAYVTIWTDWSLPILSFNIFLTGYDVQSIDLRDLLVEGDLSRPDGTTSDSDPGQRSLDNDENPLLNIRDCDILAVVLPRIFREPILTALTTGIYKNAFFLQKCNSQRVGGDHAGHAVGYVTIDVVQSCHTMFPTDPGYFTTQILYDNVLTGDYQQVNWKRDVAYGGPMVHIRAIPEGGAPAKLATNFATTFYSNIQNGGTADRRQPLPSTFAARWISGGDGQFKTDFRIWREGITRGDYVCAVAPNSALAVADVVRFDEDENPSSLVSMETFLTTSALISSDDAALPPNPDGAEAGWMYLNLNNQGVFPARPYSVASQNWVTVAMEAEGRHAVQFNAASLGNGCTPSVASTRELGAADIAPAANTIQPTFASGAPATVNNDDSCDISAVPAATLLLPYFEVDLDDSAGETTLFTITNVTALPQIARVTIWTDWAFPVLTFNLFLTGYDVQSVNLYDVLARGSITDPGSSHANAGPRSADNDENPLLDLAGCDNLLDRVPSQIQADVRSALTTGRTAACGTARVGATHERAVGYATIDVVRNCGSATPVDAGYFSAEILYDNVLIGDYQELSASRGTAQGNTLVHIRAVPEGGLSRSASSKFLRTFYSRLQNGGTLDRRQPLPSTFTARWIEDDPELATTVKIWREAATNASAGCAVSEKALMQYSDVVRFDEEENSTILYDPCGFITTCGWSVTLPPTSRLNLAIDENLDVPPNPGHAPAGWMYFNLADPSRNRPPHPIATQSWVIVSMSVRDRYSVDFDATALGNGCSAPAPSTDENGDDPAIGPAPNVNPSVEP